MIARAVEAIGTLAGLRRLASLHRLTGRVFIAPWLARVWCVAGCMTLLSLSCAPGAYAQSSDTNKSTNAQHNEPATPIPSPTGRSPSQTAIDGQGQTWAVDAYPEPEFDYDLIRQPSDQSSVAKSLRVVSWHLDDAVSAGLMARKVRPKKTWRHTFGAELRSDPSIAISPAKFDADIILLQGVRDIREVRKLFPARSWKVIASRQLLKSLDNVHTGQQRTLAQTGATAIAVRYQRGVRITAVRHLQQLTSQPSGKNPLSNATLAKSDPGHKNVASTRDVSSAGTAVRIFSGGKVRWIVNVAFSKLCRENPSQCREFEALEKWLETTASTTDTSNLPILVAGQLPTRSPSQLNLWTWLTDAHEACAHQQIELSPMTKDFQTEVINEAACIVAVTLK